ncbi:hypothetical protein PF001_g11156 [Phytophthora fragariae]|uniref:Uncharacterized protein n=1 Tax=Phytophthora fragariae TaxID=53985 RepID=A0A6A3FF61_9STRA|nr:hypothetical protein PF003_g10869 [Phytophthora fragariae]KAE8943087.1 hypothetical protein PF009_g7170 [Phytophthora fragariae]KAE8973354.1 hypothetical protein PF011_g25289 [Phytophthora fragariae]KAE9298158.1 hypothetical protein PF008_g23567 [Phytophthora fragariae]KAE9308447.1 hypothetical protein PF001_g11156 [Phytophthora fragariae]
MAVPTASLQNGSSLLLLSRYGYATETAAENVGALGAQHAFTAPEARAARGFRVCGLHRHERGAGRTLHSPADKNTSVDATYHEVDEVNGLKLINGETPSRDVRMRADSIVSSSSSSSTLKAPSSSESPRRLPLSGSCTVHCTRPQSSAPRRARPAR